MREWAWPGKAFYWAHLTSAGLLLALVLQQPMPDPSGAGWLWLMGPLLFFAGNVAADLFPIKLQDVEFTVSGIVTVASIILFPLPIAILIAAVPGLIVDVHSRKEWFKMLGNFALRVTTVVGTAVLYHALHPATRLELNSLRDVIAVGVLVGTYYVLNLVPLMLTVALAARRNVLHIMQANVQSLHLDFLGTLLLAVLTAFVWASQPWLIVVLAGVAVIVYNVFALASRLRRETVEALETIVEILDARDHYTYQHSVDVAAYSRVLAEALVNNPQEVQIITRAAYLHDIGKIGVSDQVLNKAGKLTREEFEEMKRHPVIGSRILRKYSQFRQGAEMVDAHHEAYDGSGYPDGRAADAIPFGARIIAVADSYSAMTSDRPYRNAMTSMQALEILKDGIGRHWDPIVCATFIKLVMDGKIHDGRGEPRQTDRLRVLTMSGAADAAMGDHRAG